MKKMLLFVVLFAFSAGTTVKSQGPPSGMTKCYCSYYIEFTYFKTTEWDPSPGHNCYDWQWPDDMNPYYVLNGMIYIWEGNTCINYFMIGDPDSIECDEPW